MRTHRKSGVAAILLAAVIAAVRFSPAGAAIEAGWEKNTCRFCHGKAGKLFAGSAHAKFGVLCVDCHGGDGTAIEKQDAMSPARGFKGRIGPAAIPALCASCHSNYAAMKQFGIGASQYEEYRTSVHGKRLLEQGDVRAAQCTSCHGTHLVLRVSDPKSPAFPANVPRTCEKCHGDAKLMAQYGLSTKPVSDYNKSEHAAALVKRGNTSAPSCASCHGSHGASPPGVDETVNICGRCHMDARDNYIQSPHVRSKTRCVDCHSNHFVGRPAANPFESKVAAGCLRCHKKDKSKAGAFIAKASEITRVSLDELQYAKNDIRKAASNGMDTAKLEKLYAAATAGMEQFRALQHRTTVAAIEDVLSRKVNSPAEQIQADVEDFYDARLNTRIIVGLIALCALLVFGIVFIRVKILRKKT